MNSKTSVNKLGRKKSHRDAVKRNLLTSLVIYERIQTTAARAKALRPAFDRLISDAKKDQHLALRSLSQQLYDDKALKKVLDVLVKRFAKDESGLTSLYKIGKRKGDNAQMVQVMVKGYLYKEVGKRTKKGEAKKKEKEAKQTETTAQEVRRDESMRSQVMGAGMRGKAKSRSGI